MEIPKLIYVVDDNPTYLLVLKNIFRIVFPDAEIFSFTYPEKAYEMLILPETQLPDLLITAFEMPKLSGIELIYKIKQFYDNKNSEVPFLIFLHSYSDDLASIVNKNKNLPIHAGLPKPLTISKVRSIFNISA
jgi:CheY-like chemotaxis protein